MSLLAGDDDSYEYRPLSFPAGTDRDTARHVLVVHAQYGEWELARLRLFPDGRRRVTLRRRRRRRTAVPG